MIHSCWLKTVNEIAQKERKSTKRGWGRPIKKKLTIAERLSFP